MKSLSARIGPGRSTGRQRPARAQAPTRAHDRKPRLDGAAFLGAFAGIAFLAIAVGIGGEVRAFLNLPSVLIVLGGTFAVVGLCFSLGDVALMLRTVAATFTHAMPQPASEALRVLRLAEDVRRFGVLHLEGRLAEHVARPFLHKALSMVIDGLSDSEIEAVLRYELQTTPQRLRRSVVVLHKAAEYAPAMGLIGTLIGLVQMLGRLDDPQHLGPSMAVALLTTFYGAVLSNMVFSPLAVKLDRLARNEELVCTLYLLGATSMSRQENPRRLELLFNSVLPPDQRLSYFD